MSNPCFSNELLKIGKSSRYPHEGRRKELFTTGVPDEFIVEYFACVKNHSKVESEIHKRLANFRYRSNREYFKLPLYKAIEESLKVINDRLLFHNFDENAKKTLAKVANSELKTHHSNGAVKLIKSIRDNGLNYRYIEYYRNGQIKESCNVVHGLKNGRYKRFNSFGGLESNGLMVKGMRHGLWKSGNHPKQELKYFDMGNPVLNWETFDNLGKKVSRFMGDPSANYQNNMNFKDPNDIEKEMEENHLNFKKDMVLRN